jgi:hypothetical protein
MLTSRNGGRPHNGCVEFLALRARLLRAPMSVGTEDLATPSDKGEIGASAMRITIGGCTVLW